MMQEYGEDAPAPNRNTVYLAYLDSVKHFRPEEKDAGGQVALRTMVYHEVLLAYIDRAAMIGMNALYIWSCPPLAVRPFPNSACCKLVHQMSRCDVALDLTKVSPVLASTWTETAV
jgi:hypothetical protein